MRNPFILLVEDNPDEVLLIQRAYRQSGCTHELVVVRDGAAALEYLFSPDAVQSVLPAMVLLDLKLPRIDGSEILQRLRQDRRTRLVPVVILTSSREERDLAESYERGANSYLSKPVDFTAYREMLIRVWQYWLRDNVSADQVWS